MAWRASKVKVQSLGADSSAIGQLYAASGVANPFTRPERGLRTSLGSSELGLSHVLGAEKIPTARLTMSVVLAAQEYCLRRTKGAVTSDDKLFWLYPALYIVLVTSWSARWLSCAPTSSRRWRSTGCGRTASLTNVRGRCD
jgi:hypothetical protein